MRLTRVLAAAVLSGTLLGSTASGALAGDSESDRNGHGVGTDINRAPHNLNVSPGLVHQGGTLTITLWGEDCRHGQGHIESRAFPRTPLSALRTEGAAWATPRIHQETAPGSYAITATCRGRSVVGAPFTVIHGHGPEGGAGGSVDEVSTVQAAVGAALVVAAIGGSVWVMRRRVDGGGA